MAVDQIKEETLSVGKDQSKNSKSTFWETVEAFAMALLLALFIRTFIVQAFKIPSGSMIPTLLIGDHILVNKLAYGVRVPFVENYLTEYRAPERSDVVVFIYPEDRSKDFIKRVVGVAGDSVEVRNKKVYINGRPIPDTHAYFEENDALALLGDPRRDNFGPVQVPQGRIFVMGDNRDKSYDSRFWGFVDLKDVKGKAFLIYWSWDGSDRWVRWERIGDLIY